VVQYIDILRSDLWPNLLTAVSFGLDTANFLANMFDLNAKILVEGRVSVLQKVKFILHSTDLLILQSTMAVNYCERL
jgi:hypothetical protein